MTVPEPAPRAARTSMFDLLPEVYRDPDRYRPRVVDESGMAAADAWITPDRMAEEGVTDDRVQALQQALAEARHDPGPADGTYGSRTAGAVRAFQRQRGLTVDGILGPETLGELTSPFLRRFLQGLELMLGPVEETLDNLPAYVTVGTAPAAFLDWLARIVGADLTEGWDRRRRLEAVSKALDLHRSRGTVPGLASVVGLQLGVPPGDVEVEEGGETTWDLDPDASLDPVLVSTVRVVVPEGTAALDRHDVTRLRHVLADSLPVGFSVEFAVRGTDATTVLTPPNSDPGGPS